MLLFMVLFISSFDIDNSLAHRGSLDELGGHFRNKDCVYLLHEPTELVRSVSTVDELVALIQQFNSNDCKNGLTADRIDLEGFTLGNSPFTGKSSNSPSLSSDIASLELGQRYGATLEKCVDGDTAVFSINGKSYSTRFLFIDTPESTTQKEPFGKEAADYTCRFLKSGDITIETDGDTLFDKYDRLLAWVFVDDQLHQEAITKEGLVEDFYDYGDYLYEDKVRDAMQLAKINESGLYGGTTSLLARIFKWIQAILTNLL